MKKYVFKPYHQGFPKLFNNEKKRIAALLGSGAVIEHIGSTAVPGLGGKGIIDMAIAFKKENLNEVSQKLQSLGYEFRPTFSTPDRLYFIINLPDIEEGTRRYHIHLTFPENQEWNDFLSFRNYLRKNPEAVEEYAKMKQEAAQEANDEGERYRILKRPMFEKVKTLCMQMASDGLLKFHFAPATPSQRSMLHQWFEQKHIKEWMHGVGLENTLKGLEKFFQDVSTTTYWVGYDNDTPFAFLITSPEGDDATTLDLFICDLNYMGKGFAVEMIRQFLTTHFSNVKRVLIDPEATNTRAIHVYEKVGFKIIGEFIAGWHPVPHYQMELYMKNLLEAKK